MAAAGDNRTLYVIDPAKMEVTGRIWLACASWNFNSTRTAASCWPRIRAHATPYRHQDLTVEKNAPKVGSMSAARDADLVAGLNPDYNGQIVRILSMSDLSEKGQVKFEKGQKVAAMSLDAGGKRLAVWLESVNDDSEPKGAKPPADLKGLAAEDFKLKNDGKTSMVMVFKVPAARRSASINFIILPPSLARKRFFRRQHPRGQLHEPQCKNLPQGRSHAVQSGQQLQLWVGLRSRPKRHHERRAFGRNLYQDGGFD